MKNRIYRFKRFVAISLAALMVATVASPSIISEAAKKKSSGPTYAAGDDIAFGHLDGSILSWTILNYDDTTKTALVISRKGLNSKSIVDYRRAIENVYKIAGKPPAYVRWSENYWRGWLNDTFYKNCFTDNERAKIIKTTLTAEAAKNSIQNFYHDTSLDAYYLANGKKNPMFMDIYESQTTSVDHIFFLSTDEFTTYKDTIKFETAIWPLRTNAYDDPGQGLFVNDTTKLVERKYYYSGDSIRPAMYIRLGVPEADDSASKDSKTATSTNKTTDKKTTETASTTKSTATATDTTKTAKATTSTKKTAKKSYANNGTNVGNITLPDDAAYTLKPGGTAQVALDMDYLNSTDKQYNITYKTSDANIFTVDSTGKITAASSGTANLTVRMKKSNGKVYTMSCRIDVS
ncbi:Ig-like domain (group 2) [Pseudobutyrivibrio sp. OR37]|uniref:Ig-like domain-containing protein n=1 Tax=Pseudobutyrivibrio sp. OR37 TaxID=1798186 RepID=UPI0008ECADC0|nr:DUF6273 domain-containing protein [Pseudobutyrivibrio sp. OR37]SFH68276.1 Ig-like domain (group 2) [Pseudobutyrivibrio sp. OR37]